MDDIHTPARGPIAEVASRVASARYHYTISGARGCSSDLGTRCGSSSCLVASTAGCWMRSNGERGRPSARFAVCAAVAAPLVLLVACDEVAYAPFATGTTSAIRLTSDRIHIEGDIEVSLSTCLFIGLETGGGCPASRTYALDSLSFEWVELAPGSFEIESISDLDAWPIHVEDSEVVTRRIHFVGSAKPAAGSTPCWCPGTSSGVLKIGVLTEDGVGSLEIFLDVESSCGGCT